VHGKIAYIGGDPIVVVLTEQVSDAHLAGLRRDGVSYIFAGERELDLALTLEILNRELEIMRSRWPTAARWPLPGCGRTGVRPQTNGCAASLYHDRTERTVRGASQPHAGRHCIRKAKGHSSPVHPFSFRRRAWMRRMISWSASVNTAGSAAPSS
jgi:hypothetical protein